MADAHYFHATLYKFNEEARAAVIARFNASVNDVAARCWYDAEQDLFELKCPNALGPRADEALGNAINDYIDDETKAAERQDRPPNAVRFPESSFDENDAADESEDDLDYQGTADEPPIGSLSARPSPERQEKRHIMHIVNTESAPSLSFKFFKLHELPEGLLERTLGSTSDRATTKAIHSGMSCRAVRFEGKRSGPVFNGRVGQPLPVIGAPAEGAFLNMVSFPSLQGESALPADEEDGEAGVGTTRHWKFREGEEANVSQWLAGMGQTEPDEPGQRADIPKDAKKMLVIDQNPTLGRVRVPKGTSFLPIDSDDEEEAEFTPETSTAATSKSFAQLLGRTTGGDSESEASDTQSQASKDSDETAIGAKATFASLLQSSQKKEKAIPLRATGTYDFKPAYSSLLQKAPEENNRPAPPPAPVSGPYAVAIKAHAPVVPVVRESSGAQLQPEAPDAGSESTPEQHDSFPSYGKPFAAVDTIGLTADAASQARWELDHHNPQRAKTSKGGIQLAPRATSGSVSMSLSTGPELQRLQPVPTPSSITSMSQATIRSYTDMPSGPEPWANRIVQKRTPTAMKLVDDTAPPATASSALPKYPPGLGPPPGLEHYARRNIPTNQSAAQPLRANTSGRLIEIGNEPTTTSRTALKPPPGFRPPGTATPQTLQPKKEFQQPARHTNEDDQIVERIQPQPDEPTKRYTMHQKAAPKKGKGGISKKAVKVELPMPDPVPPPRAPKARESSLQTMKAAAEPKLNSVSKASNAATAPDNSVRPAAVVSQPSLAKSEPERPSVADTLRAFVEDCGGDIIVEVHFGQILIITNDRALRKDVLSSLDTTLFGLANTTLNSRVTTSTSDAQFLCTLASGYALRCRALYEFHVKDASGSLRIVPAEIVMTDGVSKAVRMDSCNEVGRCYTHFPTRVWDAVVVAKCHDASANLEGIDSLLLSLCTTDISPSFTAIIPRAGCFTVEKVLAKREYTRDTAGGALVVTEVQELFLTSLNAPRANLQAFSLSRDEMIAENRLWWEAKMEVKDMTKLQEATELVTHMDGIGFGNRGPWMRREAEEEEPVGSEAPFW